MKKSKNIFLIVTPVLSAALFNACGGSQPYPLANSTTPIATPNPAPPLVADQTTPTRDVYNNLDDCVKDWRDKALCEQMSEDDDADYKKKYKTGGKSRYFYGPGYFANNRIITYKGKTITPTGKAASKMPTFVSSAPSSKSTTGAATSTTSTTKTSTLPSSSTTSRSSSTTSSTTSSTSPSSSTSTYNPYSSSSTTRGGFGSTSSSYSGSSSRSSSSTSSGS